MQHKEWNKYFIDILKMLEGGGGLQSYKIHSNTLKPSPYNDTDVVVFFFFFDYEKALMMSPQWF